MKNWYFHGQYGLGNNYMVLGNNEISYNIFDLRYMR